MATKSYSKHKEYKEYSSSGTIPPYTDEQFGKKSLSFSLKKDKYCLRNIYTNIEVSVRLFVPANL